ncbi:hypothetical protein [Mitsuokella jalaludinii]|uniref:hypothetical protein n=1 Tax=Mitsuokella jalaludinii TaxID=187979 RepID=UPI00307A3C35
MAAILNEITHVVVRVIHFLLTLPLFIAAALLLVASISLILILSAVSSAVLYFDPHKDDDKDTDEDEPF